MNESKVVVKDEIEVLDGEDLGIFQDAVDRRIELKGMIKLMEAEIKDLDNDILIPALTKHDVDKLAHGNYNVSIITKTNSRLDKTKLLENGCPADVIAKSMVESQSSFLEVREIKK
jgi:hypothetical protein